MKDEALNDILEVLKTTNILNNRAVIDKEFIRLVIDSYESHPSTQPQANREVVEQITHAAKIGAFTIHPAHTDEQGAALARLFRLAALQPPTAKG